MIKVLGIAPYLGMRELMLQLGDRDPDIQLDVYHGNLHEGLELAKSAEKNGYDIIISRGGTATLIRQHVQLPVVDVQVSGYDLLRIITLVKGYKGVVALLGFPSITHGASAICDLLDINIKTFTVQSEYEVEDKLNIIKQQGFDVVVGDVITVETAKNIGLQEILLTSGEESIRESFEEAKEICRVFKEIKTKAHIYEEALELSIRGIVILNSKRETIFKNKNAKPFIHDIEPWAEPQLMNVINRITSEKRIDAALITLDERVFTVSGEFHAYNQQEYIILYFDKLTTFFDKREIGIKVLNTFSNEPSRSFSRITGTSDIITATIEKAKTLSDTDIPFWTYGETGTGKTMFVQSIHQAGPGRSSPLVLLDATIINKNKWTDILFGNKKDRGLLEILKDGMIFIKNIDALPYAIAEQLGFFLNNPKEQIARLAVSSQRNPQSLLKEGVIPESLFYHLTKGILETPALKERKEDINDLSRLFIANYNSQVGKQIAGLEDRVVTELKKFSWPGNIKQLKQTIEQFMLQCSGPFIRLEEIGNIITDLQEYERPINQGALPLKGTLEEIEKQIIKVVLQEEEMNQSKAAHRLGINRTTLWRKLK